MMKKVLMILSMALMMASSMNAQFYFDGGIGMASLPKFPTPVLQLGGEKEMSRSTGVYVSLSQSISGKIAGEATLYGEQSNLYVATAYKVNLTALNIVGKRFLKRGDYDDGGFFFKGGISLAYASEKKTITDEYDQSLYSGDEVEYTYKAFQPMIPIGIGYEVELKRDLYLNFDATLTLPANRVGSMQISVNIPPFVGLNAGVRFPLG